MGTSGDGFHFLGVNETWQFHELNRFLLKTLLFPGVWGVMGSGAAANDPHFWVMHQMFGAWLLLLVLSFLLPPSAYFHLLGLTPDSAAVLSSYVTRACPR